MNISKTHKELNSSIFEENSNTIMHLHETVCNNMKMGQNKPPMDLNETNGPDGTNGSERGKGLERDERT